MEKKKFTIPYFAVLLTTFVILIAGIVLTAIFGINLGFKEAGGTQIRVNMESAIHSQATTVVKNVLKDNKICLDSMFIEDKGTTSFVVANIADKNIENIDAIESQIAAKLDIDRSAVSSVVVKSTIKDSVYLAVGLSIIGLIIALFLFGLFRYNLAGGLTLAFTFLVQTMLPLSIVLCSRLQLSLNGIVAILISAILAMVFTVIMLEKYRAKTRGKDLDDGEEVTVMKDIVKSSLESILFAIGGITLVAIFMFFMQANSVIMLAGVVVISMLTLAYNLLLVMPKTNIALSEISRFRQHARLSKNNSPEPTKKKK